MGEWQPVSTYTPDRKLVLVCDYRSGEIVIAFSEDGVRWDDGDYNDRMVGFTHWMELPDRPTPEASTLQSKGG